MQCVILAAGEGTRMRPLTLERPKPLTLVAGVTILDHIVSALPSEIDELVLVVSYKGDMIRAYCGDLFHGRRVIYVEQTDPKGGTADALFAARDVLHDRFLVMFGDDIHGAAALKEAVQQRFACLTARSETPERFGVIECNDDGTLKSIVEKPEHPTTNFVNIGGFVLETDIFEHTAERSHLGELLLTDNITHYAQTHPMLVIEQSRWIPIGYPEDVEKAERILNQEV